MFPFETSMGKSWRQIAQVLERSNADMIKLQHSNLLQIKKEFKDVTRKQRLHQRRCFLFLI